MSGVTKVVIKESADELREKMNQQLYAKQKERLQALYLLKSGKCQQITELAEILGRGRSTVHRWLDDYQQEGLGKLIGAKNKPGRKRLIPDWAVVKLEKRLRQPRGFNSYGEIQQWLKERMWS